MDWRAMWHSWSMARVGVCVYGGDHVCVRVLECGWVFECICVHARVCVCASHLPRGSLSGLEESRGPALQGG